MKKKRNNVGVFVICFIMFSLISASVTFYIVRGKQNQKERLEEKLTAGIVQEEKNLVQKINLPELFEGLEEVWLESNPGAAESIEVEGEDLKKITDFFMTVELKESEELEEEHFIFIMHMKSKNAKLHIMEDQLLVEQVQGMKQYFVMDDQKMKELVNLLEHIYMGRYNASVTFKEADSAFIEARDENRKWIVDKAEIPNLLDAIALLAPLPRDKFIEVPVSYPDYYISITSRERTYGINLINEEILSVDSPDSFSYYQYNPELWQYVSKKLPIKPTTDSHEIAYLLKSKKVVVEDAQNHYDFEDETYYPVEIPRWILKCSLKEVKELPEEERWAFMMTFTVGKEHVDLKVYQNHIIYQDKIYFSNKIADSVRSIFDVQ
ncbi:hypothetical protein [Geosporobacter ferrireducens]|uniref:DUF4340 domain-containing protein n=1 Tax=Geosporobacter ferrireducens TaxID=1424294 RepID=A0A1D8GJP7_9FIRM|nr:hypothetical protein [Geosporobacter ferrireducens]AOT71052.1 hypothetical protein Gferi_16700 [Geosporobacter ferrireducens]